MCDHLSRMVSRLSAIAWRIGQKHLPQSNSFLPGGDRRLFTMRHIIIMCPSRYRLDLGFPV